MLPFARPKVGNNIDARIAMMAMTTSSSINVNAAPPTDNTRLPFIKFLIFMDLIQGWVASFCAITNIVSRVDVANKCSSQRTVWSLSLPLPNHFSIVTPMVIFAIVMIAIALAAAIGFVMANRAPTKPSAEKIINRNQIPVAPAPVQAAVASEDVITYSPADVPAILHDALTSVPTSTAEEAMTGCYATMGTTANPYQTSSVDELLMRTMEAITELENEQHISKFTVAAQKSSKANPHVDLLAHSTEPKRIRLLRFWRTPETFIATLPN
jgi:hypothetical protein